jgi:hypothetical protein
MKYFADVTNEGLVSKLSFLSDATVRRGLITIDGHTNRIVQTENLEVATQMLSSLISQLESLRDRDSAYVTNSLPWIEEQANAVAIRTPQVHSFFFRK